MAQKRFLLDNSTNHLEPHLLLLKVGKILECRKHEDADLLYVSRVETGDVLESKILQVCSGLVNYVPISQMQGREVVVLTNLKAAKMRGIKSEAMLLAAERPKDEGAKFEVELVSPPLDSKIGDVLQFVPFTTEGPSKTLKKLIWQQLQPQLKTNSKGEVVYVEEDGTQRVLKSKDDGEGAFVKSLFNATVR